MKHQPGTEGGVEAGLVAWRRRAFDVMTAALAAVHLPSFVLIILGSGPPMGSVVRAGGIACYLVIATSALLRRVPYRARRWAFFVSLYLLIALLNVALPNGPYAQIGPVTLPVLVLVLVSAPAARIAILASATILGLAPFLRVLPAAARMVGIDPALTAGTPGLVWMQTSVRAAFLVAFMILLDRFHRFLQDSLAAQRRATAELEQEMRERQRLEREMAGIGDAERRSLGHELHDGVCQQVTAALLRCQALERRLERGGTLAAADFGAISSLLGETIDEAHNVSLGLCPLEPDPDALRPALRALTKRTREMAAILCEFVSSGDVRVLDPALAQHLYRIAQEALSNAVRHANASRIVVELRGTDTDLLLRVDDDGVGLPAETPTGGMGLRTMAYRARILEGELAIEPAPGGGTRVACRVPRLAGAPTQRHDSGDQRWIPAT